MPLVFFDVIVHLTIHLADEAKLVGPSNIGGCML